MNVPKPLVLDPYAYGAGHRGDGHDHKHRQMGSPNFNHHHKFFSVSAIVAISASLVIVLGVVVVTLLNMTARRRLAFVNHALESTCSGSSTTRSGSQPPAIGKLILLNSKSSDNDSIGLDICPSDKGFLNKAAEIGSGVFGTVYKASLGSSGHDIAIKKLITSNIIQYPEEFDRQVQILARAKHPNLITLRGYYWTPQLQLLVTDFAPNGSLQAMLHERPPSALALSWPDRFRVVLGTAKGLAHLHHSFRPPIIHYNIKPGNILLDQNLNPKVSDFGLVRLLNKLDKPMAGNLFPGMAGYVAPEMACWSLRVNEKCDVYSFGVLILEVVTGRRPLEYGEDNVVILTEHVRVMLERGNVLECIDPGMDGYPEEEVLPVLKLALVCTSQIPSSRPSMAEVVQILQVIKTPVPQRMEVF